MFEKDKELDEEKVEIEVVEDDEEVDDSIPGEGIELSDDLFDIKESTPPVEKAADSEDDDEDELSEEERKKMGKRAQKRIKKLLAKQRELENTLQEQTEKFSQITQEKQTSEQDEYKRSVDWLDNREKELETLEKTIETSYRSARNNDDIDAEWAAQKAMQQVQAERSSITTRKEQFKRVLANKEQEDFTRRPVQTQPSEGVPVERGQEGVQQPTLPDDKAMDWWQNNRWFQQDQVMTTKALKINQELLEEGYDPDNEPDEYYGALDSRIAAEFPEVKQGRKVARKKSPVTGGGRAGPQRGGKQKIRITESMRQRAARMDIPVEDYARQVQKLRDEGRDI